MKRTVTSPSPARGPRPAPATPGARRGPVRRPTTHPAPEGSAELRHLTLTALRAYRGELSAEEEQVSYWRRLVQARLDLLAADGRRADGRSGGGASPERLRALLTDAPAASRRLALVRVVPAADVPPLPDLAGLWAASPDPGDEAPRDDLLGRLAAAERELSSYRSALHRRLDRATAELIARYAADPGTCLAALPQRGADPAARRRTARAPGTAG